MVWSLLRESGHRIVAADLPGHGFAAEILRFGSFVHESLRNHCTAVPRCNFAISLSMHCTSASKASEHPRHQIDVYCRNTNGFASVVTTWEHD